MWNLITQLWEWDWAIPWTRAMIINAVFLGVANLIVGAIPIVYLFKANLRDPLARAVLAGTGATAFVFTVSLVALVAFHAGLILPGLVWDWITRITYLVVALGESIFLFALLRVIRGREDGYTEGYAAGYDADHGERSSA